MLVWVWGVPGFDVELPRGFPQDLQVNISLVMNYTETGSPELIQWSSESYPFDPSDPDQGTILPYLLGFANEVYSKPIVYEEFDTTHASAPDDPPYYNNHVVFEPSFPYLNTAACDKPGYSYFLVAVMMETPISDHRVEFINTIRDDRIDPTRAWPPPDDTGRRLNEAFVAERCAPHDEVFIWGRKIEPAPSPPPPPPPPDGGIPEREYTVAGSTVALVGFAGIVFFALYGQRWTSPPAPKCAEVPPAPFGNGFVVLAGGGGGLHDRYHDQDVVCPRRPDELLYDNDRRETRFESGKDV